MRLTWFLGRWHAVWYHGGKRHRVSLRTTDRAEAERAMRDVAAQRDRPAVLTVGEVWRRYCQEKEGAVALRRMASEWRAMAPVFGNLEPSEITVETCRAYIAARRRQGRQDGTIWTELGDLRTVLSWAHKRGLLDRVPHVERPSKPPPRERYLTREEAARLVKAANAPHVKLAIMLMLSTGARVGAVLDLTWDRVDMERGVVRLAHWDGRRRKGRATVPMTGRLRAALSEARAGALTPWVVEYAGRRVASIRTGFEGAAQRAGLEGVTPHVLRHTAAVWMAEAGVPMAEIAQVLGHEDSRITERVYSRFSPGHLARAVQHLEW